MNNRRRDQRKRSTLLHLRRTAWAVTPRLLWSSRSPSPILTHSSFVAATDSDEIVLECDGGWISNGDSGGKTRKMLQIPKTWINDGYCDCPLDGLDEPDTEACSGSIAWPGIQSSTPDDKPDR